MRNELIFEHHLMFQIPVARGAVEAELNHRFAPLRPFRLEFVAIFGIHFGIDI